jgi:predicted TPR repeat methyltransferase
MEQHYDDVAGKYDDIYLNLGYYDHIQCSKMAEKLIPDPQQQVRKTLEVFDMGCGTGLVGEEMNKAGFTEVVGVDISQGMLDEAAKKSDGQAYKELKVLYLGSPDKFPDEFKGRFDIVVAAGILAQGHLDSSVFQEMLMSAKGPGTMIIFTTRESYLNDYGYQEAMDALVTDNKWKYVDVFDFYRYDNLGEEQIGRYKKTVIKCFAYMTL